MVIWKKAQTTLNYSGQILILNSEKAPNCNFSKYNKSNECNTWRKSKWLRMELADYNTCSVH